MLSRSSQCRSSKKGQWHPPPPSGSDARLRNTGPGEELVRPRSRCGSTEYPKRRRSNQSDRKSTHRRPKHRNVQRPPERHSRPQSKNKPHRLGGERGGKRPLRSVGKSRRHPATGAGLVHVRCPGARLHPQLRVRPVTVRRRSQPRRHQQQRQTRPGEQSRQNPLASGPLQE